MEYSNCDVCGQGPWQCTCPTVKKFVTVTGRMGHGVDTVDVQVVDAAGADKQFTTTGGGDAQMGNSAGPNTTPPGAGGL